jgi:hypothetical protein
MYSNCFWGGGGVADYHSIIDKAVSALDLNTEKARRRLYERARAALHSKMHGAYPPFRRSEIAAAEMCRIEFAFATDDPVRLPLNAFMDRDHVAPQCRARLHHQPSDTKRNKPDETRGL